MPNNIVKARSYAAEAVYMTLGLWLICYVVGLLPSFADDGRMAAYGYVVMGPPMLLGLVGCFGLFWWSRLAARWPSAVRIGLLVAGLLAVAAVHAVLYAHIFDALMERLAPERLAEWRGSQTPEEIAADVRTAMAMHFGRFVPVYGVFTLMLELLRSRAAVHAHQMQLAASHAAVQETQLAALRFQLNPHFLFNTLNAISSLILTARPQDAEAMVGRLSTFMRGSMLSGDEMVSTLGDELEMIHIYLAIENVRFGDRLEAVFDTDEAAVDCLVPSLILQPLVENVVKHAVAPSANPVTVTVSAKLEGDVLAIAVEDHGGLGLAAARPGGRQGLANVRQRLHLLYGDAARLDTVATMTGFRATVRLPVRREDAALQAA